MTIFQQQKTTIQVIHFRIENRKQKIKKINIINDNEMISAYTQKSSEIYHIDGLERMKMFMLFISTNN